jgi:hypothetical protein
MSWKEILIEQVKDAYRASEGLLDLVEDELIDWKPKSGDNWMTTGELLGHMADACGFMFKGFITNEWAFEGSFAPVKTVSEGKAKLASDKQLAFDLLADLTDDDLVNRMAQAPWEKESHALGYSLTEMVSHLNAHKSQLFYYLKLQGKPVNTRHLWGMSTED